MLNLRHRVAITACLLMMFFVFIVHPGTAGDTVLSNNSGDGNAVFFIEGEPSVVINGFDLTPLGVSLPVALDAVSISVVTTVPGSSIDLLVYQDANGGSPIDATLVYREPVAIEQAGQNRIELSQAAIITQPVVWVGFNLPVGFEFYADTSGASVLTYWAWTTGGTFDVATLSAAGVFGPGDGSEPVNIAMDGIARITAELRTAETEEIASGFPLGRQVLTNVGQDTSPLRAYNNCASLLYDSADIEISADSSFTLECFVESGFHAPSPVAQPQDQTLSMLRKGALYKLSAQIPHELRVEGAVSTLPVPVTHCLRVPAEDLERAVIGEVRAQYAPAPGPEKWNILPSVRFNDIVCAEVTVANYLSYFVPDTVESPDNVNLVVGWVDVDPHPLLCGIPTSIRVPIVNTGQDWFDTDDHKITVLLQDVHVSSNIILEERRFDIGPSQFGPGARQYFEFGPFTIDTFVNQLHRLQISVDHDNEVDEIYEHDNTWFTEYQLIYPPGHDECGPISETNSLVWSISNTCAISLRISDEHERGVKLLLERLEAFVAGLPSVDRVFRLDFWPTEGPKIFETREQLRKLFDEDWDTIKSQVEAVLRLHFSCLNQR